MLRGVKVEMGNGWSVEVLFDGDLGVFGCWFGKLVVNCVEEDELCCRSW